MTEMAEKAAKIANQLDKDVNKASVQLATEYLQMNPQDFRKLVDELVTYTSKTPIPDVYLESGSNDTTIKVDSSIMPFADSALLKFPTKSSSSPAGRYVDLMNAAFDVELEKSATSGLIELSQRLPKGEAKTLINSAEDNYGNTHDDRFTESPLLNVRFRDLNKDGVDDELFDMSLIYGVRSRLYRHTQTFDLYDPPAPKSSIKIVPPPPPPAPAPVPYHSPFQKTSPSSPGSKTITILDELKK